MPMKAKQIIEKLRDDNSKRLAKKRSDYGHYGQRSIKEGRKIASANVTRAKSMIRGGTTTSRALMRTLPVVGGAALLGGYIGGRLHQRAKEKRRQMMPTQQQYEGLGGGGESVATVGEGPVMVRRGPKKIKVAKKLDAINDMLKGWNPGAQRSFKEPRKKENIKLPASVAGKTLFPDKPTPATSATYKTSVAPSKTSGPTPWHIQVFPKLERYNRGLDQAIDRAKFLDMRLAKHIRNGTDPDKDTALENFQDEFAELSYNVDKVQDFWPEEQEDIDNMPANFAIELGEASKKSGILSHYVDKIRNMAKSLGWSWIR